MRVQSKRSYAEAYEMPDGSFVVTDSHGPYRVRAKDMWTVFEPADGLREKLTRALTAQAWAVACAYLRHLTADGEYGEGVMDSMAQVARLPAPAELAEELLR